MHINSYVSKNQDLLQFTDCHDRLTEDVILLALYLDHLDNNNTYCVSGCYSSKPIIKLRELASLLIQLLLGQLDIGVPQGHELNHLLHSLYDFTVGHRSNTILNSSGDTTVLG